MTLDAVGIDIGPEMLFAMDAVLIVLLLVAIAVGLGVRRKLTHLKSARDEWAREMATFAVQAEAAESGFSRMRDALVAEATKQAAVAATRQMPAAPERLPMIDNAEPVPAPRAALATPSVVAPPHEASPPPVAPQHRRSGRPASVMSMQ